MLKFIKKLLSGILWFATAIMAGALWLNLEYSFNIFSIPHWKHLGQLQATNANILFEFYMSLIAITVIALGGFYLIVRTRKGQTPKQPKIKADDKFQKIQMNDDKFLSQNNSTNDKTAATTDFVRPPKLSLSLSPAAAPSVQQKSMPVPNSAIATKINNEGLQKIFEKAGYIVKSAPTVANLTFDLFAIGAPDILWIGSNGVSVDVFKKSLDKVYELLAEALDDLEIDIRPFIIDAKNRDDSYDIMYFDKTSDMEKYVLNNPNNNNDADSVEMFNDYNQFIDVLIKHFNKNG